MLKQSVVLLLIGFAAVCLAQGEKIVTNHTAVFTEPARHVPTDKMVDGPLMGNGDVGVVMAGPPHELRFHIGKNDFWGIRTQSPMALGYLQIRTPALQGASYRAEQDMEKAEVRGAFASVGASLSTRAWVTTNANWFFVELANTGDKPLGITVQTVKGASRALAPVDVTDTAGSVILYDPDQKPEGRKAVIGTRLLGHKLENSTVTLAPDGKALVAMIILSDLNVKNPLVEAKAEMQALTPEKAAKMSIQHREWWRNTGVALLLKSLTRCSNSIGLVRSTSSALAAAPAR